MKMNGTTTGNMDRNTSRNTPNARSNPLQRLDLLRLKEGRYQWRQRFGNNAPCSDLVESPVQLPEENNALPSLTKTVQEIEERIYYRPGHITAERFQQHSADTSTVGADHIE